MRLLFVCTSVLLLCITGCDEESSDSSSSEGEAPAPEGGELEEEDSESETPVENDTEEDGEDGEEGGETSPDAEEEQGDTSGDAGVTEDTWTAATTCSEMCTAAGVCPELSAERCNAECAQAEALECGFDCFGGENTCADIVSCLGLEPPSQSFKEGPYGTNFRDIAGPVVIPTTRGDWNFQTHFDGNDSYLFLNTTANSGDFSTFVETLWASNFNFFLWEAPTNVHVFFMTFDLSQDAIVAMEEKIQVTLSKLDEAEACWWKKRVHFVSIPAQQIVGWIGEMLGQNGWFGFAVDRAQAIRPIGLLQTVGGTPQLSFLAYEAQYYNYEAERDAKLEAEDAMIISVVEDTPIKNDFLDITLPGEAEMSQYDTLHIDMGNYCADHLDSNCGEWDYLSYIYMCEIPVEEENVWVETECQGAVTEVLPLEEAMGLCPDEETPCSPDVPCANDFECLGYVAQVEAVEGIVADTQECTCTGLNGENVESTHTCLAEGTGYGDCACACDTEIGRWITTYGREGRWISDTTPFLAYFKRGGPVRIRTQFGNSYITDLSLRFTNSGDEPVSTEVIPLFVGQPGYNETYNDKFEPRILPIPADAKKVEIMAYITGHGFGKDQANCAEFCNHEHIFTVDGTEYFHDNPWVGDNFGCAKQVGDGTVPNQYGTWYLGRGGWCPGKDVTPFRVDVTESLSPGSDATLEYKSHFEGMPYIPVPFDWGSGFGAMIRVTSYLVIYK